MRLIKAWSINIVWSDDQEEVITDIPNYVCCAVDDYLTELEEIDYQDNKQEIEDE